MARHTALNQFKFIDPLVADLYTEAQPFNHLLLNDNDIIFSQVLYWVSFHDILFSSFTGFLQGGSRLGHLPNVFIIWDELNLLT